MYEEIKIGDYVRNKISGKFGYVSDISLDQSRLKVISILRTHGSWLRKNVEKINDVVR